MEKRQERWKSSREGRKAKAGAWKSTWEGGKAAGRMGEQPEVGGGREKQPAGGSRKESGKMERELERRKSKRRGREEHPERGKMQAGGGGGVEKAGGEMEKEAARGKSICAGEAGSSAESLTGLGLLAVALLAEADGGAVQQGMQRLLLALAREAAQPAGAALGVDAAGLPGGQGAGQAAATARLLHQLAAQRRRRAQRQRFAVAGLALHEGAQAPRQPRAGAQQHQQPQQHRSGDAAGRGVRACREQGALTSLLPLRGPKKKKKNNKKIKNQKGKGAESAAPACRLPTLGFVLGLRDLPALLLALGEGDVSRFAFCLSG